jgi:hypothetical protein
MKEVSRILAFLIFVGPTHCGPDFVNCASIFDVGTAKRK